MSTLLVTPYPPLKDGIGDYSAMLGQALVRAGERIVVLTPETPATRTISRSDQSARRATAGNQRPGQARMDQAPGQQAAKQPALDARWPQVVGSLRAQPSTLLAEHGIDLVHVQFALATYAPRLRSLQRLLDSASSLGIPVLLTLHEIGRDLARGRMLARRAYLSLSNRADALIVHTELAMAAVRAALGEEAASRTHVIEHPRPSTVRSDLTRDQARAHLGLGAERVILAFGFIAKEKGLDDLLEALVLLRPQIPLGGLRLVIAGDVRPRSGAMQLFELRDRIYKRALRLRIARFGLDDHVALIGYVPASEVPLWLRAANLCVLPYRRCEQSGVASMCLAAGLPVLASNAGGLRIASSYPPFDPGDVRGLAERLRGVLTGQLVATPPGPSGELSSIAARTRALYERLRRPSLARTSPS